MNKAFISTSIVLSSLLACSIPAAQAGTVSWNFSVAVDSGPLSGQSFLGSFSFNDSQVPGTGFGGEKLYALSTFSFSFAGGSYSSADLNYADAVYSGGLGGSFLGLDAGAASFTFLPASGPFAASFAYDFGRGIAGNGDVVFTRSTVNGVPEPATLWLALGLLAGLAGVMRFGGSRGFRAGSAPRLHRDHHQGAPITR